MKYKTNMINFQDGTRIKLTYLKNGIKFESLEEVTEIHLPYMGSLLIGEAYQLSDSEFKFFFSQTEMLLYKIIHGKINMHSPKSKMFLNKDAPIKPGELEDKLEDKPKPKENDNNEN